MIFYLFLFISKYNIIKKYDNNLVTENKGNTLQYHYNVKSKIKCSLLSLLINTILIK